MLWNYETRDNIIFIHIMYVIYFIKKNFTKTSIFYLLKIYFFLKVNN